MSNNNSISIKRSLALVVSIILHGAGIYYLGSMALDYALPEGHVETVEMDYNINQGIQSETTQIDVVNTPAPVEPPVKNKEEPAKIEAAKPVAKALPEKSTDIETPVVENSPEEIPVVSPVETNEVPDDIQKDLLSDNKETPPQEEPEEQTPTPPTELPTVSEAPKAEAPPAPPQEQVSNQPYGRPEGIQSDRVLTPTPGNKSINYPTMARLRKVEGTTIVHYTVSAEGAVTDVKIAQSSGSSLLDNEAVSAIKTWKFKPTGQEGVYERPIRFKLSGDAKEAPSQLRRTN